jgi:hypothetical protein
MKQRVIIKYLREEKAMDRRKFILSWLNIMGTRHSPILSSCQLLRAVVSHGARKRWKFKMQRKTTRFSNSFQNRRSIRSIVECFSSKHCSDHRYCSVSGILCPHSSSASGIPWLAISPYKLNHDQKWTRRQLAVSLQAGPARAQRKNWTEFYIGNESRVVWKNFSKRCSLSLDEELSERVRRTIEAEKSMLTVFQSEWLRNCGFSATRR